MTPDGLIIRQSGKSGPGLFPHKKVPMPRPSIHLSRCRCLPLPQALQVPFSHYVKCYNPLPAKAILKVRNNFMMIRKRFVAFRAFKRFPRR